MRPSHRRRSPSQVDEESPSGQLGLFDRAPSGDREPDRWPAPDRFPHNEGGQRVANHVERDLDDDGDVLIVTGYASLDQIVQYLSRRLDAPASSLRILFGNEPFPSPVGTTSARGLDLAAEVRDYWLGEGFSVLLCADVMRSLDLLGSDAVEVRIAPPGRRIHAKIYASAAAATLGSSNYTPSGMGGQSEANARFEPSDDRYAETMMLAEGLWELGVDYKAGLAELLEALLRRVTWREALGRASAEILEGEWAARYVPPHEIGALRPGMWPHQLQGISQAIWILHNVGSVLVADATGSGKTRMGAWLIRAAYDRQVRSGQGRRVEPVVVAPPPVIPDWEECLQEAGLRLEVDSHGSLSSASAQAHGSLVKAIGGTELLAIDEAHNFLNPSSNRTERIRGHYADNVLLFTATPINRGASDLLSLIGLLGPDNFPDEALRTLARLERLRRKGVVQADDRDREALRREIRGFMVRRTRGELNRIVDAQQDAYAMPRRRAARYPVHEAAYYEVPASSGDLTLAARIRALADQLTGVARIGERIAMPAVLAFDGMSEEVYLQRVVRSAAALARHFILDCLRSSRAALYEHIHGTDAAIDRFAPKLRRGGKASTGDTLATLEGIAGAIPRWRLREDLRSLASPWLIDEDAHREACEREASLYRQIGELVLDISDSREHTKLELLAQRVDRRGLIIAYDSHVLTLMVFELLLKDSGLPVTLFSGAGGAAAKRKARRDLGLDSPREQLIALCTDAFSEGMNLQRSSTVVHLDTPTVIRTAEQRAGRVDRMNSPHDRVEIWWPRDPEGFAPRRKDLLRERHEMVSDLIGANLTMPFDDDGSVIDVEDLARQADRERPRDDPDELFDAFRPVRHLVEPDGLVGSDVYRAMRDSQARIVSCISVVESDRPWGFFAVGGLERVAPRWILLEDLAAPPRLDFAHIADFLVARLGPATPDHAIDSRAQSVIRDLLTRLHECEHELLPIRRQRALGLSRRVIQQWRSRAFQDGDEERRTLLLDIEAMMGPAPEGDDHPDPRAVADAWLEVIRPVRQRWTQRLRGKKLWKLDDLERPLLDHPIDNASLHRAFQRIPTLPPLARRVVVMIVGVPTDGG